MSGSSGLDHGGAHDTRVSGFSQIVSDYGANDEAGNTIAGKFDRYSLNLSSPLLFQPLTNYLLILMESRYSPNRL
jgi:hypothetical protein